MTRKPIDIFAFFKSLSRTNPGLWQSDYNSELCSSSPGHLHSSLIHSLHSRHCTPLANVHQIMSTLSFKTFHWLLIVLRVKHSFLYSHRKKDLLYGLALSSSKPHLFLPWPLATLVSILLIECAGLSTCYSLCLVHLLPIVYVCLNVTSEIPPLIYLSSFPTSLPLILSHVCLLFLYSPFHYLILFVFACRLSLFSMRAEQEPYLSCSTAYSNVLDQSMGCSRHLVSSQWMKLCINSWASLLMLSRKQSV